MKGLFLFGTIPIPQPLAERKGEQETEDGADNHDDARCNLYLSEGYDWAGDSSCHKARSSEDGTGCTRILALGIKCGGSQAWLHHSETNHQIDVESHYYH